MLVHFLFSFEMAPQKVHSMFSSTEAGRRDQLVNLQLGNFEYQDKSMTLKNGDAVETE